MKLVLFGLLTVFPTLLFAKVSVGMKAPEFELQTQEGKTFKLEERKDKGWTVLFFYPKAGTPGCTKQACAFRDSIKKIHAEGAEVYGISADTVGQQAKFHAEHKLLFPLLADPKLEVINKFDVKMMGVDMAKRWTFILDPQLVIRSIDEKVDPVMDPDHVVAELTRLKKK